METQPPTRHDAERARHDKRFRVAWLRKQLKLVGPVPTTLEGVQDWEGAEARAVRQEIDRLRDVAGCRPLCLRLQHALLSASVGDVLASGAFLCRCGQHWSFLPGYFSVIGHIPGQTLCGSGERSRYSVHSRGKTTVPCYAVVTSGGDAIHWLIGRRRGVKLAPIGHKWVCSPAGIVLRRDLDGETYQIDAADALNNLGVARKLADTVDLRIIHERIELGQLDGVWVGQEDSINAGNCPVGTDQFASDHGLSGHVRATDLPRDRPRETRLTIVAAMQREVREMRQGYCDYVATDQRNSNQDIHLLEKA